MDPLIIVFGLGVGTLVGLTGMGGGSLMTPLLIVVFGVKPVTAVGTDLAYGAVTKTVGGWRFWRHRTIDMGLSTWMAFGSVFNSAICMRAPDSVLRRWADEDGVEGLTPEVMARHYDAVERFIGVRGVRAEVQGRRN